MGIRMEDLHTPTVASGPTSAGASNGISKDQMTIKELIAEKERIESELKALSSVLDSHNVTMQTSLTTFDGYPRDDIDVAQIRTTRSRIIHIRNNYKAVMDKIEAGLHAHFAHAADRGEQAITSRGAVAATSNVVNETNAPFAKVNSVVTNGPAATAGLKAGDKIVRFGAADWLNHNRLAKVSEIVSQNIGTPIAVSILREQDGTVVRRAFLLTPRNDWGGRGLLGCHLMPL